MTLLNRARWWLLLRWPPARLVRQGMIDGNAGMLPQDIRNDYYMGGYHHGRAKYLGRSLAKPLTAKHDRA